MRNELKDLWVKFLDRRYRHEFLSSWLGDHLAAQIYYLRTQEGWTQGKLADKSHLQQPTISNLEKSCGNVNLTTLKKIASAFDVALVVKFVPFSEFARETQNITLGTEISSFKSDTLETFGKRAEMKMEYEGTLPPGNEQRYGAGSPSERNTLISPPSLKEKQDA